jgi:hypothetical protein
MLGSNCLPWANTLAYFSRAFITKKKFDNIGAKCQCYETFFFFVTNAQTKQVRVIVSNIFLQSIQEMLELTKSDKFESQSLPTNVIPGKLSSLFVQTNSRKEKVDIIIDASCQCYQPFYLTLILKK